MTDTSSASSSMTRTPIPASARAVRIMQARRATAYRDSNTLRFLTIELDHDATYGKKCPARRASTRRFHVLLNRS